MKLILALVLSSIALTAQVRDNLMEVIPKTDLSATGQLRFRDSSSSSSYHYVGFSAPPVVNANKIYILPADDGDPGQFLQTNGFGQLTWATASGGGGTPTVCGSDMQVQFNHAGTCAGDSRLLFDYGAGFLRIGVNQVFDNTKLLEWKDTAGTGITVLDLDSSNNVRVGAQLSPVNHGFMYFYVNGFNTFTMEQVGGTFGNFSPSVAYGANLGDNNAFFHATISDLALRTHGLNPATLEIEDQGGGSITQINGPPTGVSYTMALPSIAPSIGDSLQVIGIVSGVANLTWATPTSGVCGSDTWIQYNASGSCGASALFKFDYTNSLFRIGVHQVFDNAKLLEWKDTSGTGITLMDLDNANNVRIGAQLAPVTSGDMYLFVRGTNTAQFIELAGVFDFSPFTAAGAQMGGQHRWASISARRFEAVSEGGTQGSIVVDAQDAGSTTAIKGPTTGATVIWALPAVTPTAGQVLTIQSIIGSLATLQWSSSATVPGADTQLVYNKAGVLGADGNLKWEYTPKILHINGATVVNDVAGSTTFGSNSSPFGGFDGQVMTAGGSAIAGTVQIYNGVTGSPNFFLGTNVTGHSDVAMGDPFNSGWAFYPTASNGGSLGTSSNRWNNGFFTTLNTLSCTGCLPADMMTTDTAQTVTGNKTFNVPQIWANTVQIEMKDTAGSNIPMMFMGAGNNLNLGVTVNPVSGGGLFFFSQGANTLDLIGTDLSPSTDFTTGLGGLHPFGTMRGGALTLFGTNGGVVPTLNLYNQDIGSFTQIRGATTGTTYTLLMPGAEPTLGQLMVATNISGTIATMGWRNGPLDMMTTDTNQTVTATKTWNASQVFGNSFTLQWADTSLTSIPLLFLDSSDNANIGPFVNPAFNGNLYFYAGGVRKIELLASSTGNALRPSTDQGYGLGDTSHAYNVGYFGEVYLRDSSSHHSTLIFDNLNASSQVQIIGPVTTSSSFQTWQLPTTFASSGQSLGVLSTFGSQINLGWISTLNTTGSFNLSGSYFNFGNFYNRTFSGGDANCSGIADGWTGVRTDLAQIQVCIGGALKRVTLF